MTTIERTAGRENTWIYTLNVVADHVDAIVYSDAARTVVAVASQAMVPGANPFSWVGTLPASLVVGHYYFTHLPQDAANLLLGDQPDINDDVILRAISGNVSTTTEPVARLRRMTDEADPLSTYSDAQMQEYLDQFTDGTGNVDFDSAAVAVWEEKAGYFSALVDTSESGSSRKMSDLHKNAIAMATMYSKKVAAVAAPEVDLTTRPKVNRIVRT